MRDEQNLPFVFVVARRGIRSAARSRSATASADRTEITPGLADGDQVVAEGALFLQFAETQ